MLARELNKTEGVAAIELNISCPNIREKSKLVSQDAELTYDLVKTVRKATTKTLITKLSPNVTDIAQIALAAEAAGSDALALINTLVGMSIDVNTRRSRLASAAGGLGGIIDTLSALEFILAGACAVSVGTANFVDPETVVRIIDGLKDYLKKNKLGNIREMTGALNT
jgi:dihydroorotate dehydrogenase (NAD+) catalytic subunit